MIPTPIDGTHDDGQTHHRVHWSERPPRVCTHETSNADAKNTHAWFSLTSRDPPHPPPVADTIPTVPLGSLARADWMRMTGHDRRIKGLGVRPSR